MSKTFAVLAMGVLIIAVLVVALLAFQIEPKIYTIEFKNGETVSCDNIEYQPNFVICTNTDPWSGHVTKYNSYPSDSVQRVR